MRRSEEFLKSHSQFYFKTVYFVNRAHFVIYLSGTTSVNSIGL